MYQQDRGWLIQSQGCFVLWSDLRWGLFLSHAYQWHTLLTGPAVKVISMLFWNMFSKALFLLFLTSDETTWKEQQHFDWSGRRVCCSPSVGTSGQTTGQTGRQGHACAKMLSPWFSECDTMMRSCPGTNLQRFVFLLDGLFRVCLLGRLGHIQWRKWRIMSTCC